MTAQGSEYKELKSKWKDEVDVKKFSERDVAKHNSKTDLWLTIHGKVYDLTAYMKDHPGGAEVLLEVAGQDGTGAFEDVGHSDDAREILHEYLVGVSDSAVAPAALPGSGQPTAKIVRRNPTGATGSVRPQQQISIGTGAISAAVGLGGLLLAAERLSLFSSPLQHMASPEQRASHLNSVLAFIAAASGAGVIAALGLHYFEKLTNFGVGFAQYPAHIGALTHDRPSYIPAGVLLPSTYKPFRLSRKEELSPGIWRFVFDLPTKYSVLGLPIGQHVAIQASIDEHTVVRSYTPVSNNRDLGRLELLIRVYPQGQLGNYLKNLAIGSTADIRGPKGAMRYRRGMCRVIGMVAGGTGITPMYQLIRAICEDPTDTTQIILFYACRSEADIMLKQRLDGFAGASPEKLKLVYILSDPSQSWEGRKGYVDQALLAEYLPKPARDVKALLCGPPPMVNAMKKHLTSLGFDEPNAVSKMTDQIFCF